jgi:hypothetical protein
MMFFKIIKLVDADGNLQSLSPTQANFQSIIVVSINYNHRFKIRAKSSTIAEKIGTSSFIFIPKFL